MNKKTRYTIISLVAVFLFLFTFNFVLAQSVGNQLDPAPTRGSGSGLPNPLGENDPRAIIGNIIRAALGIVGSLALAVFIYGGFTWVISAGNDDKIKKGKDMIIWATLGLAVIFASYALVTFIIGAVAGT